MDDLVKRLRSRGATSIEHEAADEIERLRAEIKQLRAENKELWDDSPGAMVTRAAFALKKGEY